MRIGYASKNFGCEGEEQEIIFRQEEIRKVFQVVGQRDAGEVEDVRKWSLRRWEEMALGIYLEGFVWRRSILSSSL